jgi:DNA polymerase-3 subunit alpha
VSRNAGTHAAGVIVTDKPITEYIPLHRPTGSSVEESPIGAVTQFEMQILESLGLLKVDFLGLSTLTVMARACDLIEARHGVEMDIHSIPLDDPATYELLGRGDVLGVFQVEGAGMRRHLMEMKPRELANVVAMVALYRPGPLQFIPDYIRRMHGLEDVAYLHPELEPILKETYGITVYQEQIMYTAMNLADYSASEADNLRKAVAKKKAKVLEKHRAKFSKGAVKHGIPAATANEIFEQWEAFARYGFPKGHAADYAVICVQTAYLKAHYPVEYMTALLSVFKHDTDKVALYIADCRRMGFDVLPPNINQSGMDFTIEDGDGEKPAIRYGMSAVKNVGDGAVEIILEARNDGGPFETLEDLAHRIDLRHVGRRALECLVRVGALDSFGSRIAILESLERLMSISGSHFRAEEVGQLSFFGGEAGMEDTLHLNEIPIEVPLRRQLSWERELLGVYVSDHPLTPYLDDLSKIVSHFSVELDQADHGQSVCVAGEISHVRPYQTKTGKAMGFITLEDLQGTMELVIFSRVWGDIQFWVEPELIVLVKGKVDAERGDPKILVDEITTEFRMVSSADTAKSDSAPKNATPKKEKSPPAIHEELPPLPEEDPWHEPEVDSPVAMPAVEAVKTEVELVEASEPQLQPKADNEQDASKAVSEPIPGEEANVQATTEAFVRGDGDRCKVTVMIRSTGDKQRDSLRMRRVHGLLTSYPGQDRFAFQVFESSRHYHLEFPSSTTGFCSDLNSQLQRLLGEGSVVIEPLRYQ